MTQTYSREDASKLSRELIEHLRQGIRDTSRQDEFGQRNFALLREYAAKHGAESYPSAKDSPPELKAAQFLWDFIACQPQKGILLAAESEHDNKKNAILEDFEKLLYVRSPLKLMMCRVNGEKQATEIKDWLQEFMQKTCTWYTPGEVYVLYCVYWSGTNGENRDYAFRLQLNGQLEYASLTSERFEAV
jgi:hypothetical protein